MGKVSSNIRTESLAFCCEPGRGRDGKEHPGAATPTRSGLCAAAVRNAVGRALERQRFKGERVRKK